MTIETGAAGAAASSAAATAPAPGAAPAKPDAAGTGAAAPAIPEAGGTGGEPTKPTAAAPSTGAEPGQPAGGQPPKAPEQYSLTVPRGDEQYVDDRVRTHIERVARASGWSNEDAQAALEEYLGNVKAEQAAFLTQTKADPDYGGQHLAETQRLAKLVIDRVRPVGHARRDAFLALVNRAGAFSHIEVVSFLADLGTLMAEDRPAAGGAGAGGQPQRTADVLYPSTAAKS